MHTGRDQDGQHEGVKRRKRAPAKRHASRSPAAPSVSRAPQGLEASDLVRKGTTGLGYFSLALGALEMFAPDLILRALGMRPTRLTNMVLLACGVREMAVGAGVLKASNKAPWLWGRVAGDALDITLLGLAIGGSEASRARTGAATLAVLGITACDVVAATGAHRQELSDSSAARALQAHGRDVYASITVGVSPEQAYAKWRDFERAPEFMRLIACVREIDATRSRWEATGSQGVTLAWEAELTEDVRGKRMAWSSRAGSELLQRGSVDFNTSPDGRGTEVHVHIFYAPPGGPVGGILAGLLQPRMRLQADLRRFKQLLELGEIVISDATLTGKDERPAQPAPLGEVP